MTLGRLIEMLSAERADKVVYFGFTQPHSYRGVYEHLAFVPARSVAVTVGSLLEIARSALGQTFNGWKGGSFVMGADTEVYLASIGMTGQPFTEYLMEYILKESEFPATPPMVVGENAAEVAIRNSERKACVEFLLGLAEEYGLQTIAGSGIRLAAAALQLDGLISESEKQAKS